MKRKFEEKMSLVHLSLQKVLGTGQFYHLVTYGDRLPEGELEEKEEIFVSRFQTFLSDLINIQIDLMKKYEEVESEQLLSSLQNFSEDFSGYNFVPKILGKVPMIEKLKEIFKNVFSYRNNLLKSFNLEDIKYKNVFFEHQNLHEKTSVKIRF